MNVMEQFEAVMKQQWDEQEVSVLVGVLVFMAMTTPKGVDMFVWVSGHVQTVKVTINVNADYQSEDFRNKNDHVALEENIYLKKNNPVQELDWCIRKCKEVLDKYQQKTEAA